MNYWEQALSARIRRRRAIAAVSAGSAAAAFLAACGGDDDGGGDAPAGTPEASGLLGARNKGTPKQGGVLKHYHTSDIDHFDATISPTSQTVALSSEPFYPRMLALNTSEWPEEADGSSRGEVAESWELGEGGLQVTFKLRQNMKWDNRAPTNGRPLDAQDVLFSWDKFQKLNGSALTYGNVERVSAPDPRTIVVRMKEPDASIIQLFSARDGLYVQPREAESGFDPKREVRGHGPYILEEYVPSAKFTYARNPNYYNAGKPYPDRVEVPIIPEHATRLAQFMAGNIHTDVLQNAQDDIISTRKTADKTLLFQAGNFSASTTNFLTFGWDQGTPWGDKRVRQAASMMIDRDAYIDVIFNRDKFEVEGLEVPMRHNSVVPAGWGETYYLDPQDSKFGAEAKFLKYDVAEAKKLLAAAGHPNGFATDIYYLSGPQFGAAYLKTAELYANFFIEGGIKTTHGPIPSFDTWLSHYTRRYSVGYGIYDNNPGHSGITLIGERAYSTLAVQIKAQLHPAGLGYRGMIPPGGTLKDGDPKSNDLAVRIGREFDVQKQAALVHEMIRYQTDQMYYIPRVASEKGFTLWWPAVGYAGVDVGYPNAGNWGDLRVNWWVDSTKAPFV